MNNNFDDLKKEALSHIDVSNIDEDVKNRMKDEINNAETKEEVDNIIKYVETLEEDNKTVNHVENLEELKKEAIDEIQNLNFENPNFKDDYIALIKNSVKNKQDINIVVEDARLKNNNLYFKLLIQDVDRYIRDIQEKNKVINILNGYIENGKPKDDYTNKIEEKVEKMKTEIERQRNAYYTNSNGDTYYADVKEDGKIYNPEDSEDEKEIEKALDIATEKYNENQNHSKFSNPILNKIDENLNPLVEDVKHYEDLPKVSIVYDEQIGYRVIENKNGLYHGILKGDTWYIYPPKGFKLDSAKNVEICNLLFSKGNFKGEYNLDDELDLDRVTPAQISAPFVSVIDDPINNLSNSDILVAEGIKIDENFKNGNFKNINIPKIKNKIIKGKIPCKTKEKIQPSRFQEDLELGPTKYIEGTFIPYPRERKSNESHGDYEEYLIEHYKKYGYETEYGEDKKRKAYPHEITINNYKNNKNTKIVNHENSFNELDGVLYFISKKFGNVNFIKLEPSVQLSYLKAYKAYLKDVLQNNPSLEATVNQRLKEVTETMDSISENKLFR